MITLGIVGVVAVLTIPTLINNYQNKSWNTASEVFDKKFTEAVKTMNAQGRLGNYGGYKTTEEFVAELQNYLKINKICDREHLMECFEDTIIMNNAEVDMTGVTKSKHFGQTDWDTNIVGIQVGNGTSALVAYNPDCKSNPYENDVAVGNCYAIVYDTSGFANPNEMGKDARKNSSVLNIKGFKCIFEKDDTCYGMPFAPQPMSVDECETLKDELGIESCGTNSFHPDNYWAGAVKACGGVQNMPTKSDLANLASDLYNTSNINGGLNEVVSGLKLDKNKVMQYGFNSTGANFAVWSNERTGSASWGFQNFSQASTAYKLNLYYVSNIMAICVEK